MKKQLLFITPRIPYPPLSGERLKNLELLKILAQEYRIELLALTDEAVTEEQTKALSEICEKVHFIQKTKWQSYLNALKSLWNGLPLQVNYYYFSDVQNKVDELATKSDLVVCALIRTAQYAKKITKPKIMDMADSIAQNYIQSAAKTSSLFWRLIYKFEANKLFAFEKKAVDEFNLTFMFNQDEIKKFSSCLRMPIWVPHGVSQKLLTYSKKINGYEKAICFLGKMDYRPNVEAVKWFAQNVMPLIPEYQFYIIGASPNDEVKNLKAANVHVTGFIDDPYEIVNSCLAMVAPMQSGAGIQNKVLEGMALGQIVIGTTRAVQPLVNVQPEKDLLVANTPEEYMKAIRQLETDLKLAEIIRTQSRKYILDNFTWIAFGKIWLDKLRHF